MNIKTTCDSDYATCDMAGWHVIIETNKLDNIKETKLCKTGLHQKNCYDISKVDKK